MRPYISIDIESTGLGKDCEILQVAAILDNGDLNIPPSALPSMNVIINNKIIKNGEPYALGMNHWIFQIIKDHLDEKPTKIPVVKFNVAMQQLSELIVHCSELAMEWDKENNREPHKKIQFAGKQVGEFDLVRIYKQCQAHNFTLPKMIQHRTIDVGPMYYRHFGFVPSLNDINTITGRNKVSHDALEDSLDVIYAIRKEMLQ